jgi:uncharacterized protein (TIGR02217 family)
MSDFDFKPDVTIDEAVQYKTLISEFENGAEQRRSKWKNPLRKWSLRYKTRTLSEMNSVRDFFMGKKGAFSAFTWTNPNDSVEYMVRFVEDSFRFSLKAYQLYDFELDLIEVK